MSPSAISACAAPTDRRQWLRGLSAAALASTSLKTLAAQGITLRFSHVVAEETPKGLAANRFKLLLEQRSGGRIQVQVYPNAELYGDHDEMQALQLGAVDLLAPSLSKFGRIGFPEFELFDLPFLFDSVADVRRITQGRLGQRLLARLSHQGLVGLGYFDNGFKQMSANRPLLAPADFVGLRMRVQASRVIAAQMRALGARPVTLAFSETRRALASGVVDGTENPASNFWTQRMHEVQTDLSLTEHGYLGYAVVANQRLWMSLADNDRTLVERALQDAIIFGNLIADTQNDKALAALREAGTTRIHTLTSAQRARLAKAVEPVHQALAQRIGLGWMNELRHALNQRDPG
ncbi:MAG: DctP family TRAP transporter solute-binding subunit [Gammaproteobacteria bacterium]|uniref:DctP family TRAP transporter solute-binding subunit n=1 Tax=Rhodoferax sp. TaxID=50421 RepID=UPI001837A001|nr:DctP family TRAP transporter solute-binding subunit [Rhodoferax sp.]MBU3897974.1 DctP family TRAP transporter solute-binding subunit [Gammaproteobacteria bacterium]MBA3056635.1 DctP family TRAP transporter solute-binding subunit [Rhodoferax sp.]MBU3998903.1 DctP family TRAP transporter solute-binding subunit [Gammaproteobacteria bacterium]MBU4018635.1 DctP family TRAP transporter solute-binding subunit [Gammaproteobacteria bacterium]MBU4080870.1 DctP family TRAP transporter solute-binding s